MPTILKHPNQNIYKKQNVLLDLVRFLAACLVMIYHLCFWKNGQIPISASDPNNNWWFGWVGVQIFFVLSGYVIAFSACHANPVAFAKSRFLRLIPTVWICASMTVALTLLMDTHINLHALFASYLSTLIIYPLGIHVDVVYWTLTVELIFYFLVFLVLRFAKFSTLISIMIFIGLISALYNLVVVLIDFNLLSGSPKVFQLLEKLHHTRGGRLLLLEHGVYFSLGVLLWHLTQTPRYINFIRLVAVCLALVGSLVVFDSAKQYVAYHHTVGVFEPSALIVWLVGLFLIVIAGRASSVSFLNTPRVSYVFRLLGLTTFPLYLLHNNAGLLVLGKLSVLMPSYLALLLTIASCIACAGLVFAVLEPAVHVFFKRFWEIAIFKAKEAKLYPFVFGNV